MGKYLIVVSGHDEGLSERKACRAASLVVSAVDGQLTHLHLHVDSGMLRGSCQPECLCWG